MSRVRSRRSAAGGLAVLCLLASTAVRGQAGPAAPPADGAVDLATPLDPDSPMAPLPDLGIEWPDPATAIAVDPATAPIEPLPPAAPPATAASPAGVTPAAAAPADERRYAVRLEGLDALPDSGDFRVRFDALSLLEQGEGSAANAAQIERRAREDAETLILLLRADGYYDGEVDTRVAPGEGADARRLIVTLTVTPGPVFRFTDVTMTGVAALPETVRAAFSVKQGDPVEAEAVTAAQAALATSLGRAGYAFAKVGEPDIVVDHETRTATLALAVEPGNLQRFGGFEIQGRPLFSTRHLQVIARLKPGEPLDAAMVDDLRRALIATGLVSTATLTPVATGDPGVANLAVRLERAPPRTVAGEIGYGTGEGARVELSWQHRNLIRPEGAVTFRGVAGQQEQLVGASLRRGNFRARDQVLNMQVAASHTNRNAYDARTFTLSANLERQTNIVWQKTWTWFYGAELVATDERDVLLSTGLPRRRTYFIGALPTGIAYDGSDDLLNPTRGHRLSGRLSPEVSLRGRAFTYARVQVDGSLYVPAGERLVMAGRVRVGSIAGAGRGDIAPSRRFYVGGGGSVRGYGYQAVGPRDGNNDPIGGRSLAEFSLEARVRFGNFGVVPFLDAGNLYTSPLPRFTSLRYGAGIGVRYYSSFGPVRVDVGTPLNPRRGDTPVAVYVSLGQAF